MLRCAIVSLSLVLSSLLALPAAAEEPTKLDEAGVTKAIDTEVVSVVMKRASARGSKMSRVAVEIPEAHRVRLTGAAQTDADGKTFYAYVVEAGFKGWFVDEVAHEMKEKPEMEWTTREAGCAYDDGRVFVMRHDKAVPASTLKASKKKPTPAAKTTCVAVADVG